MLCDTCKNKHICKHFEYFKNITINLAIQIEYCELFSNNQQANNRSYQYRNSICKVQNHRKIAA